MLTNTKLVQEVLSSKPHPKRRAIVEHFYCGNSLPLFIKLEKKITRISVLISVLVKPKQRREVCNTSKIWMRLRTF